MVNQDPFTQKKKHILDSIASTNEGTLDSSPKGSIDKACIPIIDLINSFDNMVTTSSCSGRVSVFVEGIKETDDDKVKIGAKGNEGKWLFVTHEPENLNNWFEKFQLKDQEKLDVSDVAADTRYVLYKFEPLILHVKCRDLDTAKQLYAIAMACGFRESGIGSNNNVAIRCSIRLDAPIAIYDGDQDSLYKLVSTEYLKLLCKISKDRFTENFHKLSILYDSISKATFATQPEHKETKEERRERKMREGLLKQQLLKSQSSS
ncbi:Piso0_001307 [Millerozyma farinosa CBS 7064]|uniref:tRNA wybutosine-synthesizing protein 3 n=1 Tax=Pichia sorbitophila (strain ATCC MYA-4447 / BCRC 22081 / CBS 7064 / NBRC 10061 / NRRL Y-12695) TaxID=559304 RepID=G8YME4_PICSO|nr:Piso0_001307 [Millerozyma farinosa CBS 7064]